MTMLNIGCGSVTLPCEQPPHHWLVPAEIYEHNDWHNVDKIMLPGVDEIVDVMQYPWPWADNSFDGALLAHIVEHILHVPNMRMVTPENGTRISELRGLQDGWFVFFSELWRVLKPDSIAHIIVPHGNSDGAKADPTHTRYVMPHTFGYLRPDPGSTFEYNIGCNFETLPMRYSVTPMFQHLTAIPGDEEETAQRKDEALQMAMMVNLNVAYEFYAPLRVVKDNEHA